MRRLLFILLLIPNLAFAQPIPTLDVVEQDGSPKVYNPYEIEVSNGSLTDNEDGTVTIKTVGDTVTTDKVCIDSDQDTCWYKTDSATSVMTINNYVALKMIKTPVDYKLLLDEGSGGFYLLLDDGAGEYKLIIN